MFCDVTMGHMTDWINQLFSIFCDFNVWVYTQTVSQCEGGGGDCHNILDIMTGGYWKFEIYFICFVET